MILKHFVFILSANMHMLQWIVFSMQFSIRKKQSDIYKKKGR